MSAETFRLRLPDGSDYPTDTAIEKHWRPAELAAHMGVSRDTIEVRVRSGEIRSVIFLGSRRILDSDARAWLAREAAKPLRKRGRQAVKS